MNLNFTISELLKTNYNVNNMPTTKNVYDNLLKLIVLILQPVREHIKKPMIVTSGYRSPQLNALVKGSATSQHCTGEACDFVINGMTPKEIVAIIRKMPIEWGQLIEEYSGTQAWVHISLPNAKHKKEILKYQNGKYYNI